MLTDLPTVRSAVGLTDNSQDSRLSLFIPWANQAFLSYTKRQVFETTIVTEYPRPTVLGGQDLSLRERPVLCFNIPNCTITQGSNQITGIATTGTPSVNNLVVGMPVVVQASTANVVQSLPNGVTITAINTGAGSATLSANAVSSYTGQLVFGLAVWLDPSGNYGDGIVSGGVGPFGQSNQLYLGVDYNLRRDQSDGTSKSGVLRRVSGGTGTFGIGGFWGGFGWDAGYGSGYGQTLTAPQAPFWPRLDGCVKVVYAAGYGTGAGNPPSGVLPTSTTIPQDVIFAVTELAAKCYQFAEKGGEPYNSASFDGFSYTLRALRDWPDLMEPRSIIARYTQLNVG